MSNRRVCACGWRGNAWELLDARLTINATGEEVVGSYRVCPDCKDPCDVVVACDEPGCWKPVTCGTPTEEGYRTTCGKHAPNTVFTEL